MGHAALLPAHSGLTAARRIPFGATDAG